MVFWLFNSYTTRQDFCSNSSMAAGKVHIVVSGKVISVMIRQVNTPFPGFILEYRHSYALLEKRGKEVVLREAWGKWDVEVLCEVKDKIRASK